MSVNAMIAPPPLFIVQFFSDPPSPFDNFPEMKHTSIN